MEDKYKLIITYRFDESGKAFFDKVYVIDRNTKEVILEEGYDSNKHQEIMNQFFKNNNVKGTTASEIMDEAQKRGIFDTMDADDPALQEEFKKEEEDKKNLGVAFNPLGLDEDALKVEEDSHNLQRAAVAGLGAAAIIGAATAITQLVTDKDVSHEEENIDELQTLINSLNDEGKEFFNDILGSLKNINSNMTKQDNFKLAEDKTDLQFTAEELIAAKIAFNNYSDEELFKIFGTTTKVGSLSLDASSINKAMDIVYLKLSTYAMNAKEPSGISSLIEDSKSRDFFEKHENVVLEFNRNPSIENSDNVIKALYYDYTYEGMTGNYAEVGNDNVIRMATSFHYGNMLRTRNVPDYNKVHNVTDEEKANYPGTSIEVGVERTKLLEGNASLEGVLADPTFTLVEELNNKSLCAASINEVEDKMDSFNRYQQIRKAVLLSEGDKYSDELDALSKQTQTLQRITELSNKGLNINSKDDIVSLINNRFMPVPIVEKNDTKVDESIKDVVVGVDDKTGDLIFDKDKLDQLPDDKKQEIIKDNGTVTKTDTKVTEEKVDKEDLTKKEQEKVAKEEKILKEIDTVSASLQERAVKEANSYVEKEGSYKYSKTIVNPYNNEVINTNDLSIFNIVAHATAFGDGASEVNDKDSQVQNYISQKASEASRELDSLSNDAKEYLKNKYGNSWQNEMLRNSYKDTFAKEFNRELSVARQMGEQLKQDALRAYEEVSKQIEKEPIIEKDPIVSDNPVVDDNNKPSDPSYDPNLDPDYTNPGEIVWTPPVIDEPVVYLDDVQWDNVFGQSYNDVDTPKTR